MKRKGSEKQIVQLAALHIANTGRHYTPSPKQAASLAAMHTARMGTHHTVESRARMRTAHLGKKRAPFSAEHCVNISAAKVGTHHAPETIAKMTGKKLSPETIVKMSGPNNHNWLGGISREPYGWDFSAELKEEVRRRDGYKCQLCGTPQAECKRKLDVHHVDYNKKDSDPINLVALCHGCNSRVNAHREHWMAFFAAMAIRRSIAEPGRTHNG